MVSPPTTPTSSPNSYPIGILSLSTLHQKTKRLLRDKYNYNIIIKQKVTYQNWKKTEGKKPKKKRAQESETYG